MPKKYDDLKFAPRVVITNRSKTFDAEISFDGSHYTIDTGFKDRNTAKQIGEERLRELVQVLRDAGYGFLRKYPKAKL
jgi:hypothetical protein